MIKFRNVFFGLVSIAILCLSGCANADVLNPKGMIARDELHLMITALLLMFIIVIPVIIATLVIAFRYRASNTKAKYDPHFTHSVKLEIFWWGIPIVIIAILATITWISTHRLDPYRPIVTGVKPVNIEVVSLEWRWLFIYPDQGIATMNYVEFPANTPISFEITSDAPMNSFIIEQLAGQIYSMAGMRTRLHLIADEPGIYNGRSVSFSGDGFANMTFVAKAVSNDEFNQWVNTAKQSTTPLDWNTYTQLAAPSHDTSVMSFNLTDPDLFNQIIMKYMGPDMKMMPTMHHPELSNMNLATGTPMLQDKHYAYEHHKNHHSMQGEY